MSVLSTMIQSSYDIATDSKQPVVTIEDYLDTVPAVARAHFDELRGIAKKVLPHAHEVISYGIVGYKPDPKTRAVVFISGWKDHVAVYPIPKNEALRQKLEPYIRGKGTLWFVLDKPLPHELITKTIRALNT